MSEDRVLQVSVTAGVATLTLDSPANRNALSRALRAQLREALDVALTDDAVRVVVLDHTGRVFCSGMDLSEAAGGLVDLVVPDADVDGEVRAQLVHLTAGAPTALAETKRLLRARTPDLRFDELLELSARFFASDEGQEGIASFREKRSARWVPSGD